MQFYGICLVTEDVVALTQFYDNVLQTKSEINDIHTQVLVEGALLQIYSKIAAKKDMELHFEKTSGGFTLQFGVEDVDAEYERLKKLNVEFVKTPTTYAWGNRSMQFKDLDGNIITFACRLEG